MAGRRPVRAGGGVLRSRPDRRSAGRRGGAARRYVAAVVDRIQYDELALFAENAAEHGLPFDRPPVVVRRGVEVGDGRRLSALVWGSGEPEIALLHGGAQNAHTWDTVALALDRPLVAVDLPGHGHSDGPGARSGGQLSAFGNAEDVAAVVRRLAPAVRAVVGMSMGGITTIAMTEVAPDLVRRAVLVDVTPGVTGQKAEHITDFVNGPERFADFDEILTRTMAFNPTRSESSLRRGILHNAVQEPDGSWVWRHARWRLGAEAGASAVPDYGELWELVSRSPAPLLLCRGMLPGSVVDDADEAELLRRRPDARVVRFPAAGHGIQGDMPVELARVIDDFVP